MNTLKPTKSRNLYSLPTFEELQRLDQYEIEFTRQISRAIRWIYDIHGWSGVDIEKRIPGVKASVWQRYSQPGYTKARSMHVVAALSWVSQVSMSAILCGDRIARYWPQATREKIRLFIFSGMLDYDDFHIIVLKLLKLKRQSPPDVHERLEQIKEIERGIEFQKRAPEHIDIQLFAKDYYSSIAKMLKAFRVGNQFSISDMAIALNLSDQKYGRLEDEQNPVSSLSLHLAARMKLAFKIPDTVPFLAEMKAFPGFVFARSIQQHRELLYIDLLEGVGDREVSLLADYAKNAVDLNLALDRCTH